MDKPDYEYSFDPNEENNTAASIYRLASEGGKRILDLGSGPAIVSSYLKRVDGRDVTCVDLDPILLERARERGIEETFVADLEKDQWAQSLEGRVFDVIILADVLEHLSRPERVLRVIRQERFLAADGFLVVSIPNASHEAVIAELITGHFTYTSTGLLDATHVRWFTKDSFTELCDAEGFSVVTVLRTTRTLESTEYQERALDIAEEVRDLIRSAAADTHSYQYIVKLVPSGSAGLLAETRRKLETTRLELAQARGILDELQSMSGEVELRDLAPLLEESQQMRSALRRLLREERLQGSQRLQQAEETLRQLRDELLHAREQLRDSRENARRQAEYVRAERTKLRDVNREVARKHEAIGLLEEQVRQLEHRIDEAHTSFTWRAGLIVKRLAWPAAALKRIGRDGKPSAPVATITRRPNPTALPAGLEEPEIAGDRDATGPRQAPEHEPTPPNREELPGQTHTRDTATTSDANLPLRRDFWLSPVEDIELRVVYEAALARSEFSRDARRRVVIAVSTVDLDECRGDIYVAVGLGRQLERLGYEVMYLPKPVWYDVPGETDIFVAMLPTVNPGLLDVDCTTIAWVRNETVKWTQGSTLPLFDAVICTSEQTRTEVAKVYPGATSVLRVGVDTDLFRPEGGSGRAGVVTTVNQWGRERDVYRALRSTPVTFRLGIVGNMTGLATDLEPFAHGRVSFFALPSVYQGSLLVLDDFNHSTMGYGNVNSRIYEATAAGALPVTNSAVGLDDVGMTQIPVYRVWDELNPLIERLLSDADGATELAAELGREIREHHSYEVRARQFDEFLRALPRERPYDGGLVAFTPDYRSTNPYQSMLYGSLRDAGVTAIPIEDPLELVNPALMDRFASRLTIHLNWTHPVLGPAASASEAVDRRNRFLDSLDAAKERGAKVVWTIHNVLPHETRYADLERSLRQEVADRADIAHIMCSDTVAIVEDLYRLPATKVRVIPHSSYVGVYPDAVDQPTARAQLGLENEDTVLLCLGGIRPYKKLDRLLDAFEIALATDPSLRLVVAGRPSPFPGVTDLEHRCRAHPRVLANFNHIGDHDLQYFYKAADVVVLPYESILNSGAMMLAFTFGRPVIAPRMGCLKDLEQDNVGVFFDPDNHDEIRQCLERAAALRDPGFRARARQYAEAHPPEEMAAAFVQLLEELGTPAV